MSGKDRERKLVQGLQEGDAASFDEIFHEYYNKIYAFSYSYLKNREDAEGVVQDVFFTLWNKRAEAGMIRNLNAWLFTVSFNLVRKVFRKSALSRRKLEDYARTAIFEDDSEFNSLEYNDLSVFFEDHINQLPGRQRTVMLMRLKDGLSSKEISEELGINKRTVENHISSARSALKKAFSDKHLLSVFLFWMLLP